MRRGTLQFEIDKTGGLRNTAGNVERLRRLLLDRTLVEGYYLGPGDPGDFDNGAWHVGCHLAAAGGVIRAADGRLLWLQISHSPTRDQYYASISSSTDGAVVTGQLDSAEGRSLLRGATLLGFVEGTSAGRISARGVVDAPTAFNLWRRQDFDHPVDSDADGGRVWEHWCTLRDIRATATVGTSVLTAYVSLTAALGDLFAPTVARGRREYGHPEQLIALVTAGFVSKESALWEAVPIAIPSLVEPLMMESDPRQTLKAVEQLDWANPPKYYMFTRRIGGWSRRDLVEADLADD